MVAYFKAMRNRRGSTLPRKEGKGRTNTTALATAEGYTHTDTYTVSQRDTGDYVDDDDGGATS